MDLLTPLQRRLLKVIGQSPLGDEFYLTGGTALAAFYLHHRYSDDLDLFTANPTAVSRVPRVLQEIADRLALRVELTRTLDSFLEAFVHSSDGERVEFDFAQDSPYRVEPPSRDAGLGILVDSATDIACNKVSALFDRAEPKDFVDVFFVAKEMMPFEELLLLARRKHLGMDDYWLAVALARARDVAVLPRMVKPVTVAELQTFFLARAKELMGGASSPPTADDPGPAS